MKIPMGHVGTQDAPGVYLIDRQFVSQLITLNIHIDMEIVKSKANAIGLRFMFSEELPSEGDGNKAIALYFEETSRFKGWDAYEVEYLNDLVRP